MLPLSAVNGHSSDIDRTTAFDQESHHRDMALGDRAAGLVIFESADDESSSPATLIRYVVPERSLDRVKNLARPIRLPQEPKRLC